MQAEVLALLLTPLTDEEIADVRAEAGVWFESFQKAARNIEYAPRYVRTHRPTGWRA